MAIRYLAGNRQTGLNSDTKASSNIVLGTTFHETDTDDLYIWDGDSWNIVAGDSIAQTLSNKTLGTQLLITELGSSAGTPASGFGTMYAKLNKLYFKADDGTESDLTAGVGSTGSIGGASDTTFTSINDAALMLYDTGTSTWRDADMSGIATINDVGVITAHNNIITSQTGEATVNNSNDFVLIYDGSADALRKMSVSNLVAGGVSVDTLALLNDTTIASVSSAQVIIYDGTDSWDNKTVSGDISINTSGVTAIGSGVIVNADVNASAAIAMSKTALVAGTGITLATNTLNVDAAQTQITSVGALDAGSITSGFTSIDVGAGAITTTGTVTVGNLVVNGTSTRVDVSILTVVDPIIHLQTAAGGGNLSADTNKDVGIAMEYHNGSAAKEAFLGLDDSTGKLIFVPDATINSEVVSGSAGTIVAALEGNADTATTLATARTIGGTSFDGSAAIVPATITVADTTDTTTFVGLWESATGDLPPKTDAGLTYNAGTGTLTATAFVGPITGNVTGNASGTAATVTGGTQASITSAANLATVGTIATGVWNGTAIVQAYIGAEAINESKLQVSNGPTNGYFLSAQSGNTGGLTWAEVSAASESFAIAIAVAL